MKTIVFVLGMLLTVGWQAQGQGRIVFHNPTAPTRLWSQDGPLAGPDIWAQMFAGPTPTNLAAVGMAAQHGQFGVVFGGIVEVPTIPCDAHGYAQMMVWDGRLWGTSFDGVPRDQLGATDVVSVPMTCFPIPTHTPWFMQPAIVPVPEPSVVMLGILAGSLAIVSHFARRQFRHSK